MIMVLVVDDSRFMRNVVKGYFAEMKFPCTYAEATDGKEALAQLQAQKIDFILLDGNMPEMSGIDFLKQIRDMGQYEDLPIVMLTSESSMSLRRLRMAPPIIYSNSLIARYFGRRSEE
jgi:two-component system chemotaxis response regulator CheY